MSFIPPNRTKVLRKLGRLYVAEGLESGWFSDDWADSAKRYLDESKPIHWLQIVAWIATIVSPIVALTIFLFSR